MKNEEIKLVWVKNLLMMINIKNVFKMINIKNVFKKIKYNYINILKITK